MLSSIVKYQKKKYKIEDFALESIWQNDLKYEEFAKLNNFFWFFSLDLKSSKKISQTSYRVIGLTKTIAIILKVGILTLRLKE